MFSEKKIHVLLDPVQFKLSCVVDLLDFCISLVFIIIHIKCDLPDEVQVPCWENSGEGAPVYRFSG